VPGRERGREHGEKSDQISPNAGQLIQCIHCQSVTKQAAPTRQAPTHASTADPLTVSRRQPVDLRQGHLPTGPEAQPTQATRVYDEADPQLKPVGPFCSARPYQEEKTGSKKTCLFTLWRRPPACCVSGCQPAERPWNEPHSSMRTPAGWQPALPEPLLAGSPQFIQLFTSER
jgi:hypothetical protein